MIKVCPKCNSRDLTAPSLGDTKVKCDDCGYTDIIEKFPMGEYHIPLPDLQTEIDNWCDEMKVGKEGYFYKNASKMCADIIQSQLGPWKKENTKLKLLIGVMEKKLLTQGRK